MRLMHSRTNAHLLHLQTRSYAAHKALEGYYEGVVDLVDRFTEAYQGVYGVLTDYPAAFSLERDGISMLSALRAWIEEQRAEICDEDELQNIIDETLELIDGTLYKLKFLG